MSKRVHDVSDSEDSSHSVEAEVKSSKKKATKKEQPLARLTQSSGIETLDEDDETVRRTPAAFRVAEASTRPPRKEQDRLSAYIIDLSPSSGENIETYVMHIVTRKLANDFMKLIFEKKMRQKALVMTCCDDKTDNLSNEAQPRNINEHCVELLQIEEVTPKTVDEVSERNRDLKCVDDQYSNPVAGLMTIADIISKADEEFVSTTLVLFSELSFDCEDRNVGKMQRVLSKTLRDAELTVVSDRNRLEEAEYLRNVDFLKSIFTSVVTMSYQDAMNESEQWTMAEPMPMKWNATIKLFDTEIAVEAYLICGEKNVSILQKKYDEVRDGEQGEAAKQVDVPKKLVKLTADGHYQRDDDRQLIIVETEDAVQSYRFGQTAVPVAKSLQDYTEKEPSHKGFTVLGWYPVDQFSLYVKGGKGYRVFSPGNDSTGFDSLLKICAKKRKAILVDYAYSDRYEAKPGVMIPHIRKHCFIYYELIYMDTVNYLPAFDPVARRKPELEHLEKTVEVIKDSMVDDLQMKYDPQMQRIFEDVWQNRLGEMSKDAFEKMSNIKTKKGDCFELDEDFCEMLHQDIRVKKTFHSNDGIDDAPNSAQIVDDLVQYRVDASEFDKLF